MAELGLKMTRIDYEKFCNEVFKLDKNIRYIGIFDSSFSVTKMRDGLTNLLTEEETQISLKDTLSRWNTRKELQKKLGKALYAMAEYEKVKRITLPLNDKGLILVSMEPSVFHEIITKEIIEIRDRYLSE